MFQGKKLVCSSNEAGNLEVGIRRTLFNFHIFGAIANDDGYRSSSSVNMYCKPHILNFERNLP